MRMTFPAQPTTQPLVTSGQAWTVETYPHPATVNDGRERQVTAERLWDPVTERLAYPAGSLVPVDELDGLVGDAEWDAMQRGESVAVPVAPRPAKSTPKSVASAPPVTSAVPVVPDPVPPAPLV